MDVSRTTTKNHRKHEGMECGMRSSGVRGLHLRKLCEVASFPSSGHQVPRDLCPSTNIVSRPRDSNEPTPRR